MSKNYKTYTKEKWLYFTLAIVVYFLPFIIVSACLLPFVEASKGFKVAIGFGIVIVNAIPFLMGIFRKFFSHFPMCNLLAIVFLALAAFFRLDVFKNYSDAFLWIELAAAIGSIASCILWGLYNKYAEYQKSVKATVKSGAFAMKDAEPEEEAND